MCRQDGLAAGRVGGMPTRPVKQDLGARTGRGRPLPQGWCFSCCSRPWVPNREGRHFSSRALFPCGPSSRSSCGVSARVRKSRSRWPSFLPRMRNRRLQRRPRARKALNAPRPNTALNRARGAPSARAFPQRPARSAYGLMTTLPKISRSSIRRNASFTSESGSSLSMMGSSCFCWMRRSSSSRSSRMKLFEPSTWISKDQM